MWLSSVSYTTCNFTMMENPTANVVALMITFFINLTAFCIMACYTRNGARLKRHINVAAYFLMLGALFNIFRVVFNEFWVMFPITNTEVFWQVLVFGTIIYHRGNVSYIFPFGRGRK